jgi:hypothetical protein
MPSPSFDMSEQLLDLVFAALDHGIESARSGSPFTPFVMTVIGEKKTLYRFVADDFETAVNKAREYIGTLPQDVIVYAMALDGFVTLENIKQDAVIVEAEERDKGFGVLFAQRYRPLQDTQSFEVIGNPVCLGQIQQRLK